MFDGVGLDGVYYKRDGVSIVLAICSRRYMILVNFLPDKKTSSALAIGMLQVVPLPACL